MWKEFGIEYDEGAEGIDESLTELNGDGKNLHCDSLMHQQTPRGHCY